MVSFLGHKDLFLHFSRGTRDSIDWANLFKQAEQRLVVMVSGFEPTGVRGRRAKPSPSKISLMSVFRSVALFALAIPAFGQSAPPEKAVPPQNAPSSLPPTRAEVLRGAYGPYRANNSPRWTVDGGTARANIGARFAAPSRENTYPYGVVSADMFQAVVFPGQALEILI